MEKLKSVRDTENPFWYTSITMWLTKTISIRYWKTIIRRHRITDRSDYYLSCKWLYFKIKPIEYFNIENFIWKCSLINNVSSGCYATPFTHKLVPNSIYRIKRIKIDIITKKKSTSTGLDPAISLRYFEVPFSSRQYTTKNTQILAL